MNNKTSQTIHGRSGNESSCFVLFYSMFHTVPCSIPHSAFYMLPSYTAISLHINLIEQVQQLSFLDILTFISQFTLPSQTLVCLTLSIMWMIHQTSNVTVQLKEQEQSFQMIYMQKSYMCDKAQESCDSSLNFLSMLKFRYLSPIPCELFNEHSNLCVQKDP